MELKPFLRANADRVVAAGLVLVGLVAVLLGWIGVSGTGLAAEQIPFLISGGVGGAMLIVIGCTAWVSADIQDEWRRLDAIEERLGVLASPPVDSSPALGDTLPQDQPAQPEPEAEAAPAPAPTRARRRPTGAARA